MRFYMHSTFTMVAQTVLAADIKKKPPPAHYCTARERGRYHYPGFPERPI